ncbi:MAG TPA: ribonuclease HII [Candidatus Nitrosotenuis sp.]|jgi:ribonuclease HII|nr:ribonuclease HII [Candidatus Nitrosotenuis sp.]
MLVCGVDEAGRGSMIGPLVIAGVTIKQTKLKSLSQLGVRDSKKLTPLAREKLYKKITKLVDDYAVSKLNPKQIDSYVSKHKLNYLEATHMAKIIKKLQPAVSYVDSCDVNSARFGAELALLAGTGKIKSYHHADSTFVIVSAASIIAKVTRDRAISKLNKDYDLGSGYPSDVKTVSFVKEWYARHGQVPNFVRKSWAPIRQLSAQVLL